MLIHMFGGCAPTGQLVSRPSSPTAVRADQAAVSQLLLTLQVEATSRSYLGTRMLRPGETIHGGDGISLRITVNQPAYVFVVNYSRTDWSQLLFPDGQQPEQLLPGRVLHVPGGSAALKIPSEKGEEDLLVVASPRPMDEGLAKRLRLSWSPATSDKAGTRGGESPSPKQPPPPPDKDKRSSQAEKSKAPRDGLTSTERDFFFVDTADPKGIMQALAGADGTATLGFRLKHL
jgi:hypothetical protein